MGSLVAAHHSLLFAVVNQFLDVGKEDFRDLPIIAQNLYGGLAERLGAAQVINLPAIAVSANRDNLNVIAFKHSLQLFHHREKIVHGGRPS